jgi:hypothetical protein
MYGYNGQSDALTLKTGILTYCYTGSSVWTSSHSGQCSANAFAWWRWVVDQCIVYAENGGPSSSFVYKTGRGQYHCDPPGVMPCALGSGYGHFLFDKETGYPNGTAICSFWYQGTIVNGVTHSVGGCSG